MQQKETTNSLEFSNLKAVPKTGRVIAFDIGTKRVGVAVSDELQITSRTLPIIQRKTWKALLLKIIALIDEFDAVALVIGLPFNMDGTETAMATEVKRLARNLAFSIDIPIVFQDERLTSRVALDTLKSEKKTIREIKHTLDSEAAVLILNDFLALKNQTDLS